MMGATETETPPSFGTLDLLEELGIPVEDVPCQGTDHDHPADLILRLRCPASGVVNTFSVCRAIYAGIRNHLLLKCDLHGCSCGAVGTPAQVVSVGEWLR